MGLSQVGVWMRRGAEGVLALLLATMFTAFVLQIVFRYFFNLPTGWSNELTVVSWLWLVLWGSAFVLREDEEIRLDLIYSASPPRVRRVLTGLIAVSLITLYSLALPGTVSYVAFMKVESSSYLKIRMDHLYSIFVIFVVAVILRQAWALWRLFREGQGGDGMAAPTGER